MRDTSKWAEKLRKIIRDSDDFKEYVQIHGLSEKEAKRLPQLITEVELGLTLLKEVAPEEAAIAVSTLLLGYKFPFEYFQNEAKWELIQKARFYLVRRKGRQWEEGLNEYLKIPEILRIYRLQNKQDTPLLIPSSIYPLRYQLYCQTLAITPAHKIRKIQLAKAGKWYAKIFQKGEFPQEIPINIPEKVAQLALTPQVSFLSTRSNSNMGLTPLNPPLVRGGNSDSFPLVRGGNSDSFPLVRGGNSDSFPLVRGGNSDSSETVTREELLETAKEMDEKLVNAGGKAENYHSRLSGVALRLYDGESDDFLPGEELKIEKLVHIVGLLNVGKSTLLQVLMYHLAKQKKRCALIVNDVVSAVRIASLFSHRLGIPAAPILGSDRAEQLEKIYEPILATEGEEISQGAMHPVRRWFSQVCPLLGLIESEEKWDFGKEPCHQLYQKESKENQQAKNAKEEEEEPNNFEEEKTGYTCPLYYKCPRHQLEKDIATAMVWVLTPASLIHTHVPPQIFQEKMRFAEAVYRECNFLFVDEADRVQVQLDEAFAPDEVLLDNSKTSLLNKLPLNLNPLYDSNRITMKSDLFQRWINAQHEAQKALNLICSKLYNNEELVEWLEKDVFTGRSLFSRLIRELVIPPETERETKKKKLSPSERKKERENRILAGLVSPEQREKQKQFLEKLNQFFLTPLNSRQGGKLANIALSLMNGEENQLILEDIDKWWKEWLKANNIATPEKSNLKKIFDNTLLAILISVLDNLLGFLVDHLSNIGRFIDLHDISETLVHRPPRDYLPVVPNSPVGNILGFRYTRDRQTNKGGKLDYFRYVGVGRALLLNFPTLFAIDQRLGPHTVLISGTSYVPGSPAYHIKQQPTVLLEPAQANDTAGDAGIAKSQFYFSPQQKKDGKYIKISGLVGKKRDEAVREMMQEIAVKRGNIPSFLDEKIFDDLKEKGEENEEWWSDRLRLLMITGSYDEAEFISEKLNMIYHRFKDKAEAKAIVSLIRDNDPNKNGIRRGKIEGLKDTPTKILAAPLLALERGHNILNHKNKAAFGAAAFLPRPLPVPDDWQFTVQQLNAWALDNAEKPDFFQILEQENIPLTLSKIDEYFYQTAIKKMYELNCRPLFFKQLDENERRVVCATQLVKIWQIIGRLVRGGVPCIVHFLDAKFAEKSLENELDDEINSLLVGIIKELESYLDESKSKAEQTLGRSLYGAFLNALKQTKGLNYA